MQRGGRAAVQPAYSRGSDIPRCQGCRQFRSADEAGRNRETSCTRPAEAQIKTRGRSSAPLIWQCSVAFARQESAEGIDNLKPMRECLEKQPKRPRYVVYSCVQGS